MVSPMVDQQFNQLIEQGYQKQIKQLREENHLLKTNVRELHFSIGSTISECINKILKMEQVKSQLNQQDQLISLIKEICPP